MATDILVGARGGYGAAGTGHGTNLSLYVSDEVLRVGGKATVFMSPHYTDYAYSSNASNYSKPVAVRVTGLAVPASDKFTTRLQLGFSNNDRNLQILVPLTVNVTCAGAAKCFVPVPIWFLMRASLLSNWSTKIGVMTCGTPARNAAAVVPAPPW